MKKITKRQIERYTKLVAEARKLVPLIDAWKDATKTMADQNIASITIADDGTITVECVLDRKKSDSDAAVRPQVSEA